MLRLQSQEDRHFVLRQESGEGRRETNCIDGLYPLVGAGGEV